jgi:hypothetical protein
MWLIEALELKVPMRAEDLGNWPRLVDAGILQPQHASAP